MAGEETTQDSVQRASSLLLLMTFEVLDRALVRFGLFQGGEGAEVAAFPGFWIFLARIKAVFAGFELTDHFSLR
jgi:hypothetical protein